MRRLGQIDEFVCHLYAYGNCASYLQAYCKCKGGATTAPTKIPDNGLGFSGIGDYQVSRSAELAKLNGKVRLTW